MNNNTKHLTILDIIIILLIAGMSVTFAVFAWGRGIIGDTVHIDTPTASYEYPLNENKTLEIQGSDGITVIEIKNKSIRFVSSPCPNKTCICTGAISRPNMPIVCLPNRVSAYITGQAEFDDISR